MKKFVYYFMFRTKNYLVIILNIRKELQKIIITVKKQRIKFINLDNDNS